MERARPRRRLPVHGVATPRFDHFCHYYCTSLAGEPPAWLRLRISCSTRFKNANKSKGLSKTKLSRCGIVLQEKYSWREQNGINRGGQSTAVKHGQGSQRQRAPDVHGANRSSLG